MKRTATSRIVYDAETIRSAKPAWVGLLMESSNFSSNVSGGASKFRRLQQAAADAAPAEVAKKIRNLPFRANAAGVHRHGVSVLLSAHQPPKQERGGACPAACGKRKVCKHQRISSGCIGRHASSKVTEGCSNLGRSLACRAAFDA